MYQIKDVIPITHSKDKKNILFPVSEKDNTKIIYDIPGDGLDIKFVEGPKLTPNL